MVRVELGPVEGAQGLHGVTCHLYALVSRSSSLGSSQAGASWPPGNSSGFPTPFLCHSPTWGVLFLWIS